jgi:hypothetical protein
MTGPQGCSKVDVDSGNVRSSVCLKPRKCRGNQPFDGEPDVRYVILIYDNEATAPNEGAEMAKWYEYTERLKASGSYVGGEALQPTSTATTVRKQGDRVLVTDGPFAETKEQLGGFYLVDCKDIDEALRWAAEIPSAGRGPVEVRPVWDFSEG